MDTRRRQKHTSEKYYSEDQIKRVLIASGIDIVTEVESDFIIFCPFHNNKRTPAGEVHKTNGLFYCFSCQESKNLVEVIMESSGKSFFEAVRLIDSKAEDIDLEQILHNTLNKKLDFEEYDKNIIENLHKNVFKHERAMSYYHNRKINKDSIDKYKLGYSEKQDMVTIPVHAPDGTCIGFVGRSIEGKVFKNTVGLPKGKTLFNIHRAKKYDKVFVVESSFDAIRLEQVGVHAVATLGASISKEQRKLLKQYFNQIVLLADNDQAGSIMSNKLKTEFGSGCITPQLPSNIKDVSDMSDEDLKKFVNEVDDMGTVMLKWSNAHI